MSPHQSCRTPERSLAGRPSARLSKCTSRGIINKFTLEHRPGLSCKELQRLGHEVRVVLEHPAVSGIGVDDEVAIRKTPRQIVRVLGRNHSIAIAVCDKHRLLNL